MNEGEKDCAESFDLDDDVTVLFHALHEADLPFEDAAGDAHLLPFFEVFLFVDFTACGVLSSKESEECDVAGRNLGDLFLAFVAIYAEGGNRGNRIVGGLFETECILFGCHDEEHSGNYCMTDFSAVDSVFCLLREENKVNPVG